MIEIIKVKSVHNLTSMEHTVEVTPEATAVIELLGAMLATCIILWAAQIGLRILSMVSSGLGWLLGGRK